MYWQILASILWLAAFLTGYILLMLMLVKINKRLKKIISIIEEPTEISIVDRTGRVKAGR
jgi:hypothetical protein